MTFGEWLETEKLTGNTDVEYLSAWLGWVAGQKAEREKYQELIAAAEAVIPYIVQQAVGCHGEKCRESWCYSCNQEDEAQTAAAMSRMATRKLSELLDRIKNENR